MTQSTYLEKNHFMRKLLIEWLLDEYDFKSAETQINDADVRVEGDIITVFYDNGKKDIIKIELNHLY